MHPSTFSLLHLIGPVMRCREDGVFRTAERFFIPTAYLCPDVLLWFQTCLSSPTVDLARLWLIGPPTLLMLKLFGELFSIIGK